MTARPLLLLLSTEVGPGRHQPVPKLVLRVPGVVNPMVRGLAEIAYQFEQPFILPTTKFEATCGQSGTALGPVSRGPTALSDWLRVLHRGCMGIGNRLIAAGLRSPIHRILDGSFDLVRYRGRRSGETFTTPTQYATHGDGIVIFVGTPERKTWWKNFRGGRDLEVLLHGRWVPMFGKLVVGADDPVAIAPLLASYLGRYPKVARHLPRGATEAGSAIVVWCRPRTSPVPVVSDADM